MANAVPFGNLGSVDAAPRHTMGIAPSESAIAEMIYNSPPWPAFFRVTTTLRSGELICEVIAAHDVPILRHCRDTRKP